MTENEKTIAAFCAQFTPPLKYVRTERINNLPMQDAWQCSYWDNVRSIGITTVAYAGGIHAFIEAAGSGNIAETAGKVIARALGLFDSAPGSEALPEAFRGLAFDGFDTLPEGLEPGEAFIWLYRAACLRIGGSDGEKA